MPAMARYYRPAAEGTIIVIPFDALRGAAPWTAD